MSAKEAGTRFVQQAIRLDENTPLGMKLGVLIAIVTSVWVAASAWNGVINRGDGNAKDIAVIGAKVDRIDDKIERATGSIDRLSARYVFLVHPLSRHIRRAWVGVWVDAVGLRRLQGPRISS